MPGVWNLDSPQALLQKMESDLARMRSAPQDARPAYDFFVTAYHMLEWAERDEKRRQALFKASPLLQIAGHIATGAKHFNPTSKTWRQVHGTETGMRGPLGATPAGIPTPLWLILDENAAKQVPCAVEITAVALGQLLLDWWKHQLHPP